MDQHHERSDGSGYPARRFDKDISTMGKLCAVADSFSAIVGDRPYHSALDTADAVRLLIGDGKRYDPALTSLLAKVMDERVTE
jgi:HD-GYP domain-containing protein (c-di-GMP phosphodiesterase class II)